jgi:hypothetical protein
MIKGLSKMGMKFSSFTTRVEDLGDGEIILGHPTRHWRVQNTIEVNTSLGDAAFRIRMELVGDNFYSKDIMLSTNPTIAPDSTLMVQFGDLIPEQNAASARREMSRLPKTLPLKSVATMTSHTGPTDMKMTTTSLVTKIETVKVPRSFFEVPRRYKKVEMPAIVPPGIIQ